MKLKKTAAIFLTVAAAAGAIGIGATSASAAPLPVTVHSQQVDSPPTMPTSAESWKILGIDLIYDGKTMGAPSPDVKGATNQPMFWGTGFSGAASARGASSAPQTNCGGCATAGGAVTLFVWRA